MRNPPNLKSPDFQAFFSNQYLFTEIRLHVEIWLLQERHLFLAENQLLSFFFILLILRSGE